MDGDGWPRGPGAPSPGPGSGSEPRRRPRAGHWSTASRLESWTPEPSVLPSTLWSIDRCERHFYFSLWKFSFRSLSVVSQPDVNENEAGPKFLRGGGGHSPANTFSRYRLSSYLLVALSTPCYRMSSANCNIFPLQQQRKTQLAGDLWKPCLETEDCISG